MSRKKIDPEELHDTTGPMNGVAKQDALAWTGLPDMEHLSKLEPKVKRKVLAKKAKAKLSSKKDDRRKAKQTIRYIEDEK